MRSEPQVKAMSDGATAREDGGVQGADCRGCWKDHRGEARVAAEKQALEDICRGVRVVREADGRAVNMRHFDVQLVGGMVRTRAKSPK